MFLHRLALAMKEPDVDALAGRLTLTQFRRWCGYYLLEPFGTDWQRTARLATWFAMVMGSKIDDEAEAKFLPTYRSIPQTDEEIMRELSKIPGLRKRQEGG